MGTASTLRGHLTKHKQSEQHILHKENDKRRGDNQTDRLNGHNKPRHDKKISKILSHKRKNGLKKIRRTLKKEAESGESLILTLKRFYGLTQHFPSFYITHLRSRYWITNSFILPHVVK